MKTLLLLLSLVVALETRAEENLFGYTYGAETLPKGSSEIYQWITRRSGKGRGTYTAYDLKTEFEHGFTDHFQASVYLNFERFDIQGVGTPFQNLKRGLDWQGAQTAFKWNLRSPYQDGLGVAVYLEPGYARYHSVTGIRQDEIELETKLILQKDFYEGLLQWAFNLTPEIEFEHEGAEWEPEFILEASTGLAYRFAPKWFGGLEARYHSEYPEFHAREHYAIFLGPTIHYGAKDWWFTFTYLPQIVGRPAESGRKIHLEEHEKNEFRLKIGYNF
jgi:hypothetical protein